jgi:serine/threonine protein phosphatase PrpC
MLNFPITLHIASATHPGFKRKGKPNEDSLVTLQGERVLSDGQRSPFGLFVVADGMGGHANGQEASYLAIETIVNCLLSRLSSNEPCNSDTLVNLLVEGVLAANAAVYRRNMEYHTDAGSTLTAALVVGKMAYVANVGDSRTYLYRDPEGLRKITNDHSVVASLVTAGIIEPDEIYTHPNRNQIYRSLGEKPLIDVDTFAVPLQPGDRLLLCSDGLWDMVRDPFIEQVMSQVPDPAQTCPALIHAALDGGGEDNVSVIVVSVTETTTRPDLAGAQVSTPYHGSRPRYAASLPSSVAMQVENEVTNPILALVFIVLLLCWQAVCRKVSEVVSLSWQDEPLTAEEIAALSFSSSQEVWR